MDRAEFTESAPGQLVPIPHTSADVAWAFVPDPLPPDWEWPERLWPLLVEARACLSSLNGTGKHLPNPQILLRPLQQREAQLSSQLEGTFTDPAKQALFQSDPRYAVSEGDPVNQYREVFNYGRALRLRREGPSQQLPLSQRLIRELHAVLMDGVRGHAQRAGEFRTIQNQIGHPARFVPPPPGELPRLLSDFENYLHVDNPRFDPLVRAFLAHYQFETIHPFGDGNGRVGRLLLALMIAEWCDQSSPWLYMSAFFESRRKEYMDLMLRVSTHGSWDLWIEFCLKGVIEQAKDTERRCERLLALHRDFHQRIKGGGSVRLSTLVDSLFDSPVLTVLTVKNTFGITYPTARADLRKLEGLGIVKELHGLPTITYYCQPIYEVTYEGVES